MPTSDPDRGARHAVIARDSTGRRPESIFVGTEHEHEEPFEVGDINFEITACRPQHRQLDGAHRGSGTDSDARHVQPTGNH
ncbi:hypothetical protein [Actinoplanes xinjiangensis]|uniref:hypothetical protein n=1 Tax=Actinoplanes xinjiangensis TaxID=512350 RepID=UPI00343551C7